MMKVDVWMVKMMYLLQNILFYYYLIHLCVNWNGAVCAV